MLDDMMMGNGGGVIILAWGAGGGSRPSPAALGGAGAFVAYSGDIPSGTQLTAVVGAPGGNGSGAGGGGYSGVFLGSVSQASALVVAGGGAGAAGDNLGGRAGGTGIGQTGEAYSGTALKGGSSGDGTLTGTGGYPGGGNGYESPGQRSTGGGGSGYIGGAAGYVSWGPMGSAPGYGGSCYVAVGGTITPGNSAIPGNPDAQERGTSGNPETAGKVVVYINGTLYLTLSTPQAYTFTIP